VEKAAGKEKLVRKLRDREKELGRKRLKDLVSKEMSEEKKMKRLQHKLEEKEKKVDEAISRERRRKKSNGDTKEEKDEDTDESSKEDLSSAGGESIRIREDNRKRGNMTKAPENEDIARSLNWLNYPNLTVLKFL